jgi:hypothetical protein
MSNDETALEPLPQDIAIGESGLALRTHADVKFAAETFWKSGAVQGRFKNEAQVAVAILTGSEAGLSPGASLRALYPVNNVMAWETWAVRALILKSGLLEPGSKIEEGVEHAEGCKDKEGGQCADGCYGYFQTHRRGQITPTRHTFSVADAKRAKLWMKKGARGDSAWVTHPKRMLAHRACGFHGKDGWGDILMGLDTRDAVEDYPQAAFVHANGETVADYTDPPGQDPLLPRAIGENEIRGETVQEEEGATHGEPVGKTTEPAAEAETHDTAEAPDSAPSTLDEDIAKAVEAGEEPQPEDEDPAHEEEPDPLPIHCEGCREKIDLDTEVTWKTPTGRRCQECGPRPEAHTP